jgi:hypothetical protein
MQRRIRVALGACCCLVAAAASAAAQEGTVIPDLKELAVGKGATMPADASVSWAENAKGRAALKLQSSKDDTVIILNDVQFGNGVIEFDALGQSAPPQSSFLGVAFRVADAQVHDAVYFRPFNFRAGTSEQRSHAVQYISSPTHSWQQLRASKPGEYESAIEPAPDGDAWFHVRVVVEKPTVTVYVNGAEAPSLVVNELSPRNGGGVGLWVGPGQGGYVANLRITHSK